MGRPLLHDVDDTLWTARAVILDDLGRHRQARGFIRLERGHDILRLGQERRHAARIKDRLTRTVGADRIHGMRRIPQQRHAAEGPVREGITIAHGVFVEFRRGTDDLDWIDGGKLEYPLDVRQDFIKPTEAVQSSRRGGGAEPSPSLAATAQFRRVVPGVVVWFEMG